MNGKRAKALREVAVQIAMTEVEPDKTGQLPATRYTHQPHQKSIGGKMHKQLPSLRLGPCVRKIEKEAKREYHNLTRYG